jgi:hypothetical protein
MLLGCLWNTFHQFLAEMRNTEVRLSNNVHLETALSGRHLCHGMVICPADNAGENLSASAREDLVHPGDRGLLLQDSVAHRTPVLRAFFEKSSEKLLAVAQII